MKVLFFSSAFPQPHDPAKSPYNLHRCLALARLGHEVDVISPRPWWARDAKGVIDAAPLHVALPMFIYPRGLFRSSHEWFMWQSVRRTADRVTNRLRPDVVLSYWTFPDGAVALRIARRAGVPCVAMVGGSDVLSIDSSRLDAAARRVADILRRVQAVVTVGTNLKERICALGVPPERVHVLPPGVDDHVFSPGDRFQARTQLGLRLDVPVIVWVGRMVDVKALDVLVGAVHLVRQVRPSLRLHLIGDGPLRRTVETQVRERGLQQNVVFGGRASQAELATWYRAADLTVLSSHWEGTPNVLLESHACGTPFVATAVGSVPELVVPGADELVPTGNPEALSRAILSALDRVPDRHAIARASDKGWEGTALALGTVLKAVVDARTPSSY